MVLSWTPKHIHHLLFAPHKLLQAEPWKSWVLQQGGFTAIYALLGSLPLRPGDAEVLQAILADPGASVIQYATRLNLQPSSYHARKKILIAKLVDLLSASGALGSPSTLTLPGGTVTFLFTDIEGSTRLWEQHPAAMQEALARHDDLLRSAIEARQGYLFKTVGDAVCAAFSQAPDALAAAVDAQRLLHADSWGELGAIRVRMALHTGPAEQRNNDYFGPTLNRVARLLVAGYGGQVLLSGTTQALVGEALPAATRLVDLGQHRLRDLTQPEQIFQLVAAGLAHDFPPLKTLTLQVTNLPIQPTSLIGRDQDVQQVINLLRQHSVGLVTLTGPGGVGKTRLSLQVAQELQEPGEVFFVPLAAISDAALVAPTILQTLGLKAAAHESPVASLVAHVRERRMLLVLDNFEQVISTAELISTLLSAAPGLKLLISSRTLLRIYGEHEYVVAPLALPAAPEKTPSAPMLEELAQNPAVMLLCQRIQAVTPGFQLAIDNAAAIAGICVRLDGLPLALELAAVRSKLFSPAMLLTRLDQRLKLLTSGARNLPARQQTLRGAIDWSYALLTPAEQQIFGRLSIFVGGWTLEAAEAICVQDELELAVIDGLEALLNHSLIQTDQQTKQEQRLRMLETIREYAQEALGSGVEYQAVADHHLYYYVELLERLEPAIVESQQIVALDTLGSEYPNLRAAFQHGMATAQFALTARIVAVVWRLVHLQDIYHELWTWVQQLLPHAAALPTGIQARLLHAAGALANSRGLYVQAQTWWQASLELYRAAGNQDGESKVLSNLGVSELHQGRYAAAQDYYQQSLALSRQIGAGRQITVALNNVAVALVLQEQYAAALPYYQEILALHSASNDPISYAGALGQLGQLYVAMGNYEQARSILDESLAQLTTFGIRNLDHILARGVVARELQQPTEAREWIHQVLADDCGEPRVIVTGLINWVTLELMEDQVERAAMLLGQINQQLAAMIWQPPPRLAREHATAHQTSQERLDPAAWQRAWERGRTLTLEDLLALLQATP